jgi:hypothetical protein
MSSDLAQILRRVVEEDYESEREGIEGRLDRYKALILEIARVKRFNIAIWVEGSDTRFQKDERDLSLLERANLVKGQMNYTRDSHNAYREYELTEKGAELATKLLNEISRPSTESQPTTT